MEEICTICYDQLPIPVFQPTTETVIIGECTRLRCGHAMHSVCLANALQITRGTCPMCNGRDNRDNNWNARAARQDECFKQLEAVKRRLDVSEGLKDYSAFNREYSQKVSEFRKRVKEFKKQLLEEMSIEQLEKDIARIRSETRAIFKKAAKDMGGIYSNAVLQTALGSQYTLDSWLFKRQYKCSYRIHRLLYGI